MDNCPVSSVCFLYENCLSAVCLLGNCKRGKLAAMAWSQFGWHQQRNRVAYEMVAHGKYFMEAGNAFPQRFHTYYLG